MLPKGPFSILSPVICQREKIPTDLVCHRLQRTLVHLLLGIGACEPRTGRGQVQCPPVAAPEERFLQRGEPAVVDS